MVAFEWPSASTAQLVVSIRHTADPAWGVWDPSRIFGGKRAQRVTSSDRFSPEVDFDQPTLSGPAGQQTLAQDYGNNYSFQRIGARHRSTYSPGFAGSAAIVAAAPAIQRARFSEGQVRREQYCSDLLNPDLLRSHRLGVPACLHGFVLGCTHSTKPARQQKQK
jgi:hypothetical protein